MRKRLPGRERRPQPTTIPEATKTRIFGFTRSPFVKRAVDGLDGAVVLDTRPRNAPRIRRLNSMKTPGRAQPVPRKRGTRPGFPPGAVSCSTRQASDLTLRLTLLAERHAKRRKSSSIE